MTGTAEETTTWVPLRPGLLDAGGERLLGSRCPSCGSCYFPARQICARCLGELESRALSTRGALYTYTVVHQAPPGFVAPYLLGYVDLPEGVRVLGQIEGVEPDAVRIGLELELRVEPVGENGEGRQVLGWRFRPVGGGE